MTDLQDLVNNIVVDFTDKVNSQLEADPFSFNDDTIDSIKTACLELAAMAQLQYVKISLLQMRLAEELDDTLVGDNSFTPSGE